MRYLLKFEILVRGNEKLCNLRESGVITFEDVLNTIIELYETFEGTKLAKEIESSLVDENGDDIDYTLSELNKLYRDWYNTAWELCNQKIQGITVPSLMQKMAIKLDCDITTYDDKVEVWANDDDIVKLALNTDKVADAINTHCNGVLVKINEITFTADDRMYRTLVLNEI